MLRLAATPSKRSAAARAVTGWVPGAQSTADITVGPAARTGRLVARHWAAERAAPLVLTGGLCRKQREFLQKSVGGGRGRRGALRGQGAAGGLGGRGGAPAGVAPAAGALSRRRRGNRRGGGSGRRQGERGGAVRAGGGAGLRRRPPGSRGGRRARLPRAHVRALFRQEGAAPAAPRRSRAGPRRARRARGVLGVGGALGYGC